MNTGLDIRSFTKSVSTSTKNQLLIDQHKYANNDSEDVDLCLLLQRDVLSAFDPHSSQCPNKIGILFEEVSHFVYFTFNHVQKRNVTQLEMEIQSEVDRILLSKFILDNHNSLHSQLITKRYCCPKYEFSRGTAADFLSKLSHSDSKKWSKRDHKKIISFFHSDLTQKIHLSRI